MRSRSIKRFVGDSNPLLRLRRGRVTANSGEEAIIAEDTVQAEAETAYFEDGMLKEAGEEEEAETMEWSMDMEDNTDQVNIQDATAEAEVAEENRERRSLERILGI